MDYNHITTRGSDSSKVGKSTSSKKSANLGESRKSGKSESDKTSRNEGESEKTGTSVSDKTSSNEGSSEKRGESKSFANIGCQISFTVPIHGRFPSTANNC